MWYVGRGVPMDAGAPSHALLGIFLVVKSAVAFAAGDPPAETIIAMASGKRRRMMMIIVP